MGFLDNSGDIILDAVLTDLGRKRLAQGNFSITQFALGDEEIDYSLYDINHPSGSAYYDLEILQTPILEAFTNNSSTMKSSLVTYSNTDLLFLPILDLNEGTRTSCAALNATTKTMLLTANSATEAIDGMIGNDHKTGLLFGNRTSDSDSRFIRIDQVLPVSGDTDTPLSSDLRESEYTVHVDYRLLRVADTAGNEVSTAMVDDDFRAMYVVSTDNSLFVNTIEINADDDKSVAEVRGQVGSRLNFKLMPSTDVKNSNTLFTRVGTSNVTVGSLGLSTTGGAEKFRTIDTIITIEGSKNGITIDIPVRIIKLQS